MVASGVIALFLLADALVRGGIADLLLLAPWVLLVWWVLYQMTSASFVRVDDGGLTVQNFVRRTTAGWRNVDDIVLEWQLEITFLDDSRVSCMGGPSRTRPTRVTAAERRAGGYGEPSGMREFRDIRSRWQKGMASDDPRVDAEVERSWDVPALVSLAVIVVWALIALLITRL